MEIGLAKIVFGDNGDASFLTINALKYILPFFDPVDQNYDDYVGEIKPLPPVILSERL